MRYIFRLQLLHCNHSATNVSPAQKPFTKQEAAFCTVSQTIRVSEWRHQIFNNNLYCVIARALNLSKGGQLRLHYICDKHLVKGIIQSKPLMVLHLKVIRPLEPTTYILNLRATIPFFRSDHTCGSPRMIFRRPQKI